MTPETEAKKPVGTFGPQVVVLFGGLTLFSADLLPKLTSLIFGKPCAEAFGFWHWPGSELRRREDGAGPLRDVSADDGSPAVRPVEAVCRFRILQFLGIRSQGFGSASKSKIGVLGIAKCGKQGFDRV